MSIAIQSRMNTLIETLAGQMRQPISIAFRLVRLGYFTDIEPAVEYVDRALGTTHGRN